MGMWDNDQRVTPNQLLAPLGVLLCWSITIPKDWTELGMLRV